MDTNGNLSTIERIKKEAIEHAFMNDSGHLSEEERGWAINDYTDGAISERNKTIDEVKVLFNPLFKIPPEKENLIEILETLKKMFVEIETLKL